MVTTPTKTALLIIAGLIVGQVCGIGVVAAQNILSVQTTSTDPGEAGVVIPIDLVVDQGLTLLRFDVAFDPVFCAVVDDKNGDGDVDGVVLGTDSSVAADKDIVVTSSARVTGFAQEESFQCADGIIPVGVFSLDGTTVIPTTNGNIFNIELDIREDALPSTIGFTLSPENAQGRQGPLAVSMASQPGELFVGTPCITAADCNDDNLCTQDLCVAGFCQHPAEICNDDGISCTAESCDPVLGCISTPVDALCDDSDMCTQDVCNLLAGCEYSPVPPACGNGCLESGEECDDGNIEDGDGCSASCLLEIVEPLIFEDSFE